MKVPSVDSDRAAILALKALTFLAHLDGALDGFVALSGIAPQDLRAGADDPEILAAVLDFVLADDARVTGFCEEEGIDPKTLYAARRALPGA
jgi:hypothetical protein